MYLNANIPPIECFVRGNYLRDQKDSNRKISPLTIAQDATVIDTSGMNFNEQLTKIRKHIESKISI